jgi:hypothetical protein
MYHYLIELAFWILLAFFIGCFLGGLARMRFGAVETNAEKPAPVVEAAVQPVFIKPTKIVKSKKIVAAKAKPVKRARQK